MRTNGAGDTCRQSTNEKENAEMMDGWGGGMALWWLALRDLRS
jgi:hypothetical protein